MNASTTALQALCRRSRGLTLIEILIALLVLSIGLLGLAGLQTMSLKFNTSAFHRTQATALAYDMADRMRANRVAALGNEYNIGLGEPQACGEPDGDGSLADQDIEIWLNEISCRLPLGTGAIVPDGNEFTLTIQWDDSQGQQEPMDFEFTTAL